MFGSEMHLFVFVLVRHGHIDHPTKSSVVIWVFLRLRPNIRDAPSKLLFAIVPKNLFQLGRYKRIYNLRPELVLRLSKVETHIRGSILLSESPTAVS